MKYYELIKKCQILEASCEAANIPKSAIREVIQGFKAFTAKQLKTKQAKYYISIKKAKERESKLIRAAINYPDSLSEVDDFEDGAKLLYEKSGLEVIKCITRRR